MLRIKNRTFSLLDFFRPCYSIGRPGIHESYFRCIFLWSQLPADENGDRRGQQRGSVTERKIDESPRTGRDRSSNNLFNVGVEIRGVSTFFQEDIVELLIDKSRSASFEFYITSALLQFPIMLQCDKYLYIKEKTTSIHLSRLVSFSTLYSYTVVPSTMQESLYAIPFSETHRSVCFLGVLIDPRLIAFRFLRRTDASTFLILNPIAFTVVSPIAALANFNPYLLAPLHTFAFLNQAAMLIYNNIGSLKKAG